MAENKQPVSLFSHIFSSTQKAFQSINTVCDQALLSLFDRLNTSATFVFDRGFDRGSLFQLFHDHNKNREQQQYYVIRIKDNRKVCWKNKRLELPVLSAARKGKIKTNIQVWNRDRSHLEQHTVYATHLKVRLTKDLPETFLVFIYGFTEQPMILASNRPIRGKDDVVRIICLYMSPERGDGKRCLCPAGAV